MTEETTSAADALRSEHQGRRVLVAEDDTLTRALLIELLAGAGLEVDGAANGVEAVAMAARAQYDLILMDVRMEKMDGLRAAHAIRLLPGCAETPIIAMSGNSLAEDRDAAQLAGMSDYLTKPARPDALFAVVLQWLERGRREDAPS